MSRISIAELSPGIMLAETGPNVSHAAVADFFAELRELALRDRFTLIIDSSPLGMGRVRLVGVGSAALAGMSRLPRPTTGAGIVGTAMVITSFDVRAMTGVILAAVRPPWPTRVVKTHVEAVALSRVWLTGEDAALGNPNVIAM